MNIEDRLNQVAERYRNLGFNVVVDPGPEDLPLFANDFKVTLVATGDKGNVLVSAKASPTELEADPDLVRNVEITEKQPGWRFDVLVLGPDQQPTAEKVAPRELNDEDIGSHLDAVEQILRVDSGQPDTQKALTEQAFVAAWAPLEAAMRRRLRVEGEDAGWGTSPRTILNQLYSSGAVSTAVFRELEGMFAVRNSIVHGFTTPIVVDYLLVMRLVQLARLLLEESHSPRQSA